MATDHSAVVLEGNQDMPMDDGDSLSVRDDAASRASSTAAERKPRPLTMEMLLERQQQILMQHQQQRKLAKAAPMPSPDIQERPRPVSPPSEHPSPPPHNLQESTIGNQLDSTGNPALESIRNAGNRPRPMMAMSPDRSSGIASLDNPNRELNSSGHQREMKTARPSYHREMSRRADMARAVSMRGLGVVSRNASDLSTASLHSDSSMHSDAAHSNVSGRIRRNLNPTPGVVPPGAAEAPTAAARLAAAQQRSMLIAQQQQREFVMRGRSASLEPVGETPPDSMEETPPPGVGQRSFPPQPLYPGNGSPASSIHGPQPGYRSQQSPSSMRQMPLMQSNAGHGMGPPIDHDHQFGPPSPAMDRYGEPPRTMDRYGPAPQPIDRYGSPMDRMNAPSPLMDRRMPERYGSPHMAGMGHPDMRRQGPPMRFPYAPQGLPRQSHFHPRDVPPPPMPAERAVEIAPGQHVRLRGAEETWAAIEQGFYLPATCFGCTLDLYCIQDADFVLCPLCRVISPVDGISETQRNSLMRRGGGLGLGFTGEDLRQWQSDMHVHRRRGPRMIYS